MLRAKEFWLAFISDQDVSNFKWTVKDETLESIFSQVIDSSHKMKIKFSSFSEDELIQVLHLTRSWGKNDLCRYEYIMHVINHSTYHRGQIITMARTLGITNGIPGTDYNFFHLPVSQTAL
jgi:uncharacterized damage-inducible protein DinB